MKHYHVTIQGEADSGGLTSFSYSSRRDAERSAADEKRLIIDQGYESGFIPKVSGSARSGLIVIDEGRGLDTIITVNVCSESGCEPDDE